MRSSLPNFFFIIAIMKLSEDILKLINSLNQKSVIKDELNELYKIDQDKAWSKIEKINVKKFSFAARITILSASVAAAAILLYFGITANEKENNLVVENKIERRDNGKSYIMTSLGERIEFETDTTTTHTNGIVSYEKIEKMVRCVASTAVNDNSRNTIVVPKGETLKVVLSDGTLVWLNSDSRLTYPNAFKTECREIELQGEGYFEVTSNAKHPFIVKGNGLNVNVTGTKFNVLNYATQQEKCVTLIEGVVDVEIDNNKNKLTPSEQFKYNTTTKTISKTKVNPLLYISWTKDRIFLKDISLDEIAIIVDRWYNVKIEYSDVNVGKETFTGEIYRYDLPEDIMNFITKAADLKWKTNGKGRVIIY